MRIRSVDSSLLPTMPGGLEKIIGRMTIDGRSEEAGKSFWQRTPPVGA
jgi:hypothetical protein